MLLFSQQPQSLLWSPVELMWSYQEHLQASLNGQKKAYRNCVCSPRAERWQQETKYYPYRKKKWKVSPF